MMKRELTVYPTLELISQVQTGHRIAPRTHRWAASAATLKREIRVHAIKSAVGRSLMVNYS